MDLNSVANGVITAVNPNATLTIQISTGYTTSQSGKRTPAYAARLTAFGQVQSLTYNDIQHLDSLNIQGARHAIYIEGHIDGLVREENKGGDLITMADGSIWLVAIVLENWPLWCKVAVTRQNIPPN